MSQGNSGRKPGGGSSREDGSVYVCGMVDRGLHRGTVLINVRSRNKSDSETERLDSSGTAGSQKVEEDSEELDTLNTTAEYWGAVNPPPTINLSMSEEAKRQWKQSYLEDPIFKRIALDDASQYDKLGSGRRFFVDQEGMIFFNNEDYQPRLCVPVGQRNFVLMEAHEH